jgi:hypothetical protein
MTKRRQAAIWVAVLAIICGAIIWHVIHWHSTGMYLEMLGWAETEKAYLTVLYNLGLMILCGVALGFLMKKITDLVGYEVGETGHSDDDNNTKD